MGSPLGSRLVVRLGIRGQLLVGLTLAAAGMLWLSLLSAGDGYLAHVFGPLTLAGLGIGLLFVPMTMAATSDVPLHQAGLASGLINTTRQVGGAVGLAVLATVAGGASSPTAGYDRAFTISAVAMLMGAALALMLPKGPRPQSQSPAAEELSSGTK